MALLVQHVAHVERRTLGRGRELGRRLQVQHAALFGEGKAVELSRAVAWNTPDNGIDDIGQQDAHSASFKLDARPGVPIRSDGVAAVNNLHLTKEFNFTMNEFNAAGNSFRV